MPKDNAFSKVGFRKASNPLSAARSGAIAQDTSTTTTKLLVLLYVTTRLPNCSCVELGIADLMRRTSQACAVSKSFPADSGAYFKDCTHTDSKL